MSAWNSQPIPRIGSSKNKVLFLSKSKNMKASAASSVPSASSASTNDRLKEVENLKVNQTDSHISSYFASTSAQEEPQTTEKGKGRQEPIKSIGTERVDAVEDGQKAIKEDAEMSIGYSDDDDTFWQQAANMTDKMEQSEAKEPIQGGHDDDYDMDTNLNYKSEKRKGISDEIDIETPRLASLCVSDNKSDEPAKPIIKKKKSMVGEDVFTKESVKNWQEPRVRAWQLRHTSPEAFYFRFVTPGEGVKTGPWSPAEQALFMKRYDHWITNDYKIGASWGMFSYAIPHRVGYQCMGNYRRLVSAGQLKDESYEVICGKLKQTNKGKPPGTTVPVMSKLGPEWESEEIKEIERNVDQWVKEFHSAILKNGPSTRRSAGAKKAAPRVLDSTMRTFMKNVSSKKRHIPEYSSLLESADPDVAHLQERDWETEWKTRLQNYKYFLEPFLVKEKRHRYWLDKQEWRRGLTTTEMILRKNTLLLQKSTNNENSNGNTNTKVQQASLSKFFTGVKKRKIDTPDEFISIVRIPNDLFSGVKQIQPLTKKSDSDPTKYIYVELNDMNECTTILDEIIADSIGDKSASSDIGQVQSDIEGILVDPPWDHYVADGKNDGNCTWNLRDFSNLMEKVIKHMTAGMVFVWTHKMIQADVVRTMYNLDCKYVENLVWFKKSVNNVHLDEPSPYISSTKEILLMFKKGDGFELRHQRSPDVIIDFQRPVIDWIEDEYTEPKPPAVYDMIETLLPKASYDETIGRGRFLELWAKKKSPKREGWITFHERKMANEHATVKTEIKQESIPEEIKLEPMDEYHLL